MENDPRIVFERMFGGSRSTDRKARLAQIEADKSMLDSVTERVAEFNRRMGARDRAKVAEYLEAVRDIERRIQKAEEQSSKELPVVEQPGGIPASFEDHARLMFDMQVLAYQTDLTRVITFMLGRELSGRTFPEIGVVESHHATSHHQDNPAKIANLLKIKTLHSTLFGYDLEKLKSTPDGDGSLLDHVLILYGSGMGDSNQHAPTNLAVLIAGGAAGRIKSGRHVKYAAGTPLANLHLSVLDVFGVPTVERMGDSTGRLEQLSALQRGHVPLAAPRGSRDAPGGVREEHAEHRPLLVHRRRVDRLAGRLSGAGNPGDRGTRRVDQHLPARAVRERELRRSPRVQQLGDGVTLPRAHQLVDVSGARRRRGDDQCQDEHAEPLVHGSSSGSGYSPPLPLN